ncbi:MAG: hypothetical protein FWB97_07300 [Oscillospiraceae bacterium]|nr:hypothetical protein [Oscillospiraceae bacterium]
MSKEQQTPFSVWTDMNKQMLEAWSAWASKAMPVLPGTGETTEANPFQAYYDFFNKSFSQNPLLSSMPATGRDFTEQMYKSWFDGMKNMSTFIPNQAARDGFDRFMNSFNVFTGLQSYWDNYLKNIPTDMKDWETFYKNALQQYQDVSKGLAMSFAPEQMKGLLALPQEAMGSIQQTLLQLFKPWVEDSAALQTYLQKALQGDKDAYKEFLDEWSKLFKDSVGKMLNMPAVGANRASIEKMMKLLDDYVKFSVRYGELSSIFSTMLSGAMEKILGYLAELHADGKQPQTFMEFYSIWSSFNEKAAAEVYSTEEFARIMNETVSAGSKLQIMYDDFMQDLLAFLPIPNRRELDDVEMEVYKLRKTVKTLEKDLKDVKTLLSKMPGAPAVSDK